MSKPLACGQPAIQPSSNFAAQQNRILITHDRGTMPRYFFERIAAEKSNNPGLLIVRQECAIGAVIESLMLIWAASPQEEWRDRMEYL